MTGHEVASLVEKHSPLVYKALTTVIADQAKRLEIYNEIISRKAYLRYLDSIISEGPLRTKLIIIAVYEAIDEPDMAIHEINKYMYS